MDSSPSPVQVCNTIPQSRAQSLTLFSSNHPFDASYKALPGQSPSFSIDHYSSSFHLKKVMEAQERDKDLASSGLTDVSKNDCSTSSTSSSATTTPTTRLKDSKVFCSQLAGLSGKEERRLIQSSRKLNSTPLTDGEKKIMKNFELDDEDSKPFKVTPRVISDDFEFPNGKYPEVIERSRVGAIFFQPRGFLGPAWNSRTRSSSVSSSCELELSHEASDKKFLDAITRSISRGCFNVDLDGQGICSIPDFAEVMERERFNDTSKNQLLSSKLFKPIQSSLSRQSISRVRSAPSVSFAPSQSVTLYLSNNYISSASNLERLCNFKGLQVLTLRANQLTELPESIGDLISLTQLNISYNQLRFLPSSVLRLKSCKFFTAGNPWIKSSDEGFKPINGNTNSAGSNKKDEDVPSLAEICLRKICRINGNDDRDRYKIDRACETREDVDYESIIDSGRFPDSIKSVLRFPEQHFKRCVCGEYRLNLKYEGIKFRCLNPFEAQPLVPIRFRAAHSGCLRALLS